MVHTALNPVAFLDPSVLKFNVRVLELLTTRGGRVLPQALTIIELSESWTVKQNVNIRLAQLGKTMHDQYGPKICHT